MTEKETGAELTGRARVRALLIDPLTEGGMRFRNGTPQDKVKARLADLADDLAYMSDQGLVAVRHWIGCHGEGSAKCFWPSRIAIGSVAEAFEKRPIEELPKLLSWFASNAGARALEGDRLVAEYEFFRSRKRPPINADEHKRIADKAADWTRRITIACEREGRGQIVSQEERAFVEWYQQRLEYVTSLVRKEAAA